MTENLEHCVKLLLDNEEKVKIEAQQMLLKICNNIMKYPQEQRYRKLYLSNAVVSSKLLPAAGAIVCLFEAGFIEDTDGFLLPMNSSLEGIKKLYNLLNNILQSTNKQQIWSTLSNQKKTSTLAQEQEYKKQSFIQQLLKHFHDILKYEDESLQNKVKSVLPLEKLQITAMERLRKIQRNMKIKNIENDVVFEDLLLSELLRWFKFDFFKWVDSPTCSNCMGECSFDRQIAASDSRISRIEIHKCKNCGYENKFPRYTDPETLLYTRKGRCGEWANCFTLICRTVGFDVRLVYDQTDHVWTEVWSSAHNRWIHTDACENVMDQPLLYEKGWGKKLTYVIAFSKDEVQDVTWRYTHNYGDVINRRKIFPSEETLTLLISKLNFKRQNSNEYSKSRKKFVLKRSVIELAELITAPPGCKKISEILNDEKNYSERISGSISWRISRGEIN